MSKQYTSECTSLLLRLFLYPILIFSYDSKLGWRRVICVFCFSFYSFFIPLFHRKVDIKLTRFIHWKTTSSEAKCSWQSHFCGYHHRSTIIIVFSVTCFRFLWFRILTFFKSNDFMWLFVRQCLVKWFPTRGGSDSYLCVPIKSYN